MSRTERGQGGTEHSLAELASVVAGALHGDGTLPIHGVAGIKEAQPGEITFLGNPRYEEWLGKTKATAIILPREHPFNGRPSIRVDDPYAAFHRLMTLFHSEHRLVPPGIHPTALVDPSVKLGQDVAIGPYVMIAAGSVIGDRVTILPGTIIGPEVKIGPECLIYPHVVLREETELGARVIVHAGAVIGDDGFGFATRDGRHEKVPQLGRVILEDDVEIGSNTCIDRATAGVTVIRRGTRIDNLVQVAHNVTIGEDSILCAQVGIAGSTSVGNRVVLAGQVGIVGHIDIGDEAKVGAQGGVTKSNPPATEVSGYPATPHHQAKRMYAALRHLPELQREVRRLRERVKELEERGGERS